MFISCEPVFSDDCVTKNADYPGGFISMTMDVSTVQDCAQLCSSTTNCVAFVLSPVARSCSLKDESHGDISHSTSVAQKGGIAGLINCNDLDEDESSDISVDGFDRE